MRPTRSCALPLALATREEGRYRRKRGAEHAGCGKRGNRHAVASLAQRCAIAAGRGSAVATRSHVTASAAGVPAVAVATGTTAVAAAVTAATAGACAGADTAAVAASLTGAAALTGNFFHSRFFMYRLRLIVIVFPDGVRIRCRLFLHIFFSRIFFVVCIAVFNVGIIAATAATAEQ